LKKPRNIKRLALFGDFHTTAYNHEQQHLNNTKQIDVKNSVNNMYVPICVCVYIYYILCAFDAGRR